MTLIGVNPRTLQQPAPSAERWWAGTPAPESNEPRREAYKRTPNLRTHQLDFLEVLGAARTALSLAQSARRAVTEPLTHSLRAPAAEPVLVPAASRGHVRAAGMRDVARWIGLNGILRESILPARGGFVRLRRAAPMPVR